MSAGDPVFTIGHPGEMGSWVTHVGILNPEDELKSQITQTKNITSSIPCMQGCSGSPIFNMNGDVIAVIYGGSVVESPPLALQLYTRIRFLEGVLSLGTTANAASSLVTKFLAEESKDE
jgi:V8-like Glu-specific endopeptidase